MKNIKNKLELVRREGICKLLIKTYEEDEEELKNKIEQVSGSYPRDLKVLYKLNKGQLISIVKKSNISQEKIDETFDQYRYGLKPGFMIFYFNANKSMSKSKIKGAIEGKLKIIHYDEEAKYKNLILKAEEEIKENEIIEYSFTYLKRYPYIDEEECPNAIYELEECFVWVSTTNNFIAIKNSPNKIVQILQQIFGEIYETELNNIKLNNKLVEEIFGNDRRKATAINIAPDNKKAEKITISDRNFKDKGLDKELEGYDITGDSLNITVDDVKNILGLKREKGKLYLTRNMTAKNFRNWSTQTIKKIVDYLTNNEKDFETFGSINIMSNDCWKNYNSKIKRIIEEICYKIYIFCTEGKEDSILKIEKIEECPELKKYFYGIDLIECPVCNEIVFPSCECGGHVTMRGENIFCDICGKKLKEVFCEDGHKIKLDDENIITYYYPKIEILDNIKNTMKRNFSINFQGAFVLNTENNVSIIEEEKGYIIDINDIEEFCEMNQLKIEEKEKEALTLDLQRLDEKCKGGKCNNCNKECLMKIFTTYSGYRPSAHQGHEFGDITFEVNYKNEKIQFVGIAKSYINNKSGNFTLGSRQAGEMIRQILCATYDKRVQIIGAVCPNRFDDQLRQTIRYIAQVTKTKICIFDDEIMLKQLKYYKNKIHS